MRARRLTPSELHALAPDSLAGAVMLAPVRLPDGVIPKGARLSPARATALRDAAGGGLVERPIRLAWLEPGDLHEDEAAERLARAVAGSGVECRPPRQSRLDLAAGGDGVLHVRTAALARLNGVDPLEVFTLLHGQAVVAGQVVASVKVAPHVVAEARVDEGVRIARAEGPVVEVRFYRPVRVAAIVEETLTDAALARFEAGARLKVEALGSEFVGTTVVGDGDADTAAAAAETALTELVRRRDVRVILVGGVSAGDPVSSFFAVLERLGGRVLRRGVPAHPGSMIWLARLDDATLLGVPQCGMFTMATAADLVLPRLLTGERLDAEVLAELGHGGLLGREMRFRFPPYARDLEAPEG